MTDSPRLGSHPTAHSTPMEGAGQWDMNPILDVGDIISVDSLNYQYAHLCFVFLVSFNLSFKFPLRYLQGSSLFAYEFGVPSEKRHRRLAGSLYLLQ